MPAIHIKARNLYLDPAHINRIEVKEAKDDHPELTIFIGAGLVKLEGPDAGTFLGWYADTFLAAQIDDGKFLEREVQGPQQKIIRAAAGAVPPIIDPNA